MEKALGEKTPFFPCPCCNQSQSCIQLTLLGFSSTEERMEMRDSEG